MGKITGFGKILEYQKTHPKLSKLDVGEFGYLLPWQFRLTKKGDLFMQDTEIDPEFGGTRCVKVTRISDQKDGFDVDFSRMYDGADVDMVESEEHLSDGIVCGSDLIWIKIGNLKKMELKS